MKNKKISQSINWPILITLFLIAVVIAAVSLIRTPQNIQKGAFFSNATVSILPNDGTFKVGEVVPASIFVNSPNAKVDQVDATVCFDKTKLSIVNISTDVVAETASGFQFVDPIMTQDGGCVRSAFLSNGNPEILKSGSVKIGTIKFKAMTTGTVAVTLTQNSLVVAGDNPTSPTDKSIRVDSVANASFNIVSADSTITTVPPVTGTRPTAGVVQPTATPTPIPATGDAPTVVFKVVLAGVREFTSSNQTCANDLKVAVTAINSAGVEKYYANVPLTKVGSKTRGEAVYAMWEGRVQLNGFSATNGMALLIKGPKHVQMKYGINNQTEYYNEANGQLNLTSGVNQLDFSGYPLLSGDVVGSTDSENNPDGIVNGRDYSYVLNKFGTTDRQGDLDYDCAMSTQDLQLVKLTLNERQSQKY